MAGKTSTNGAKPRSIRPLGDFLATESAGGLLLCLGAVIALVWANSPWHHAYESLWSSNITLSIGSIRRSMDLRHVVNEGLMTLFFLVIGLEVKREFLEGELRDPKRAAFPIVAALGGMAIPALVYATVNIGGPGANAWGIPMATDIAVALAALSFFGKSLHASHKLFLLTLAIVDDVGSVLVIAFFYSRAVDPWFLAVTGLLLTFSFVLQRLRVDRFALTLPLGVTAWITTKESGIHATLVGVAFGLLTPSRPTRNRRAIDLEQAARGSEDQHSSDSVVEWLEHLLHPWTSFVIVPVFAFANAGIRLTSADLSDALRSRITIGVVLALAVGKAGGIFFTGYLAVRLRLAIMFDGLSWSTLPGVAAFGGIGFTVSLFISDLAFVDERLTKQAKIGVLVGTVLATIIGAVALRFTSRTTSSIATNDGAQTEYH